MRPRIILGLLVVAGALAALTLAAPASFSGPQLEAVGDPPSSLALTAEDGKAAEAKLTVVVRNDSDAAGDLQARWELEDGRRIKAVPVTTDHLSLTLAPGASRRIGAHEVRTLRLVLTAETVPAKRLTGTIVIGLDGADVAPLAFALTAGPSTDARFAKAKLRPSSVEVSVNWCWTRFLNMLSSHLRCTPVGETQVGASGIAAGTALKAGAIGSGSGQSSTGGSASAELVSPALAAGDTEATLTADLLEVGRSGSYTIEVPAGSAKDAPVVTIKVNAKDAFVLPLLVLLAGAWLGWWLAKRGDQVRPREVLQLALADTAVRHKADAARVNGSSGKVVPYRLTPLFPSGPTWSCSTGADQEAVALYCRAEAATTQEELDAIGVEIADLQARVGAWPGIVDKATVLKAAVDELAAQHPALSRRLSEASRKLYTSAGVPADGAATTAYATSLDEQALAIGRWRAGADQLGRATELWDATKDLDLSASERELHNACHPRALRDELATTKSLGDLETYGTLQRLREVVRILLTLQATHPAPAAILNFLEHQRTTRVEGPPAPAPDLTPVPTASTSSPPMTADRLRAQIVKRDLLDFLITAAVTVAAYFATAYDDATYGSLWQYVTAFAAGAGGQAAINWKLLPWYRSYRVTAAKPAS